MKNRISKKFLNISALSAAFVMSVACVHIEASNSSVEQTAASLAQESITEEIVVANPNLLSVKSLNNFQTTVDLAKAGIDKRGFKTFAVIDHAAGAASIDQTLRPTTLIIFGNPQGGTPLMQSAQTMGIELPLKILVHEDESGLVSVSWPDMATVFAKHGVVDRDPILQKIQGALNAIATEAGTN